MSDEKNALDKTTNDISNYVELLDQIPDQEVVMFNFAVNDPTNETFEKIMTEQGHRLGDKTDEWSCHLQGGNQSDNYLSDVWSPTMTAKEAKEIMPKLVAALDEAKISSNLIVPMLAKDVLKDTPVYEQPTSEFDNQLLEMLGKADYDQCQKSDWQYYSRDDKEFIYDLFGEKGDLSQSPSQFAAGATTLEGIKKEFPAEEYLFSGTMVSDDYFAMSSRAGRNGTLYATPFIDYAKKYDGIYDLGADRRGGYSVTGDAYKSSVIADLQGEPVHLGFINVYKQSDKDRFFKNFGMDDARSTDSTHLSKQEALDGYLSNYIDGNGDPVSVRDAETFVSKEKNPLVAKIMHIKCGKDEYFIKVPEKPNELTHFLLNSKQADIKDTFKRNKPQLLDRLSQQKDELEKGFVKGTAKLNANTSELTEVEKIKLLRQGQSIMPASGKANEISQEIPTIQKDEKAPNSQENGQMIQEKDTSLEGSVSMDFKGFTVNNYKELRGINSPTSHTPQKSLQTNHVDFNAVEFARKEKEKR